MGIVIAGCTRSLEAQIQLDRFFPPVVTQGATTSVKAEGKFPSWPCEFHCDRSDIKITAEKDSGSLSVTVEPHALAGVVWVRATDQSSASSQIPIQITSLGVSSEKEPNNNAAEANQVDLPTIVASRLEKSRDLDQFQFALQANQTLVATLIAHQVFRAPMDAVLQLVDLEGNIIAQSDDTRGLDPQIVYTSAANEELVLRVFAFPETPNSTVGFAGAATFVYQLCLTSGPFVDHALPLVHPRVDRSVNTQVHGINLPEKIDPRSIRHGTTEMVTSSLAGTPGSQWHPTEFEDCVVLHHSDENSPATIKTLPSLFSGHFHRPGQVHRLVFEAKKGTKYRLQVHSEKFGLLVDSRLRLTNAEDGVELASNDDKVRREYDAGLDYSAKADAKVQVEVSDVVDGYGPRHAYTLALSEVRPTVDLSVAEDHFAVKPSGTVEIPVSINRRDGFSQRIQVVAERLPEGVSLAPVVSEPKGDSAKSVKLKLVATAKTSAFQGPIRLVGKPIDADENPTDQPVAVRFGLRPMIFTDQIWLSIAPKE